MNKKLLKLLYIITAISLVVFFFYSVTVAPEFILISPAISVILLGAYKVFCFIKNKAISLGAHQVEPDGGNGLRLFALFHGVLLIIVGCAVILNAL